MKKLICFSLAILLAAAFVTCEKDTRLSNSAANVYDVTSVQKSDADLSGAKCPPCSEETAWVGLLPYVPSGRGNWATYVEFPGFNELEFIRVGRNLDYIGWVRFKSTADPEMVYIEIYLENDWCLKSVEEPVKIQGYNDMPSGNPKPGLFNTYKGIPVFSVNKYITGTFSLFPYYGIHLDVGCCD